jgi:pimeloyl-ACP methyl ester carboxylesterase
VPWFDVLAYDSRAHGESGGNACTYGYYEKRDLSRAIDLIGLRPVVALGISLGAAVALHVHVPVLLIHGAADTETPATHSQRVFSVLGGDKRLLLVPGAGHNDVLRAEVWTEIDAWLDAAIPVHQP